METTNHSYTDDNAGLMTLTTPGTLSFEQEAETFVDYTQKVLLARQLLS
jgi:hypothetical protein